MKIVETRKSLEPCTESGWDAVDVLLEEGLTDEDIRTIGKAGGSFLYLTGLRRPFFKLESHNHIPFRKVLHGKILVGSKRDFAFVRREILEVEARVVVFQPVL